MLNQIPKFNTYYEPFLGSGALFFELQPSRAVINDLNEELINVYKTIRDNPKALANKLHRMNLNTEEYYYFIRGLDREESWKDFTQEFKAARTIYLNKTGFNGLYRVNRKGQFNVPYGKHEKKINIEEELYRDISSYLKKNDIKILRTDFEEATKTAIKGDFVFCDPPYYPLSKTSSFTSYTKEGFKNEDHFRLHKTLCELNERGVKFLLCNSYCSFNLELYKDFNIIKVKANRCINSDPDKRGKIKEIMVRNY